MENNFTLEDARNLLDVFTLNDLLERADLAEEEVLVFLVESGIMDPPETKPL